MLRSVKTTLTAKRDGLRLHFECGHCQAVQTLLHAEILYAIHRQACIAALKKYTLWSRYILGIQLIVKLFASGRRNPGNMVEGP